MDLGEFFSNLDEFFSNLDEARKKLDEREPNQTDLEKLIFLALTH